MQVLVLLKVNSLIVSPEVMDAFVLVLFALYTQCGNGRI